MSFFLGLPVAESTRINDSNKQHHEQPIKEHAEDLSRQIVADEEYQDLLLEQEDFIPKEAESAKIDSVNIQNSTSTNQKNRSFRVSHSDDEGDLEIIGVAESEQSVHTPSELINTTKGSISSKATSVRSKTLSGRPSKIRKLEPPLFSPKNSTPFDAPDRSINHVLFAVKGLQTEKQELQADLNSYIKKYEKISQDMKTAMSRYNGLRLQVESTRKFQANFEIEMQKFAEQKKEYGAIIKELKEEKRILTDQITDLKNKVEKLESTGNKLSIDFKALSTEASTRKNKLTLLIIITYC